MTMFDKALEEEDLLYSRLVETIPDKRELLNQFKARVLTTRAPPLQEFWQRKALNL